MRRIFAVAALALLVGSCGNDKTNTEIAASATPSACPSTRFEAGYLPSGVEETNAKAVVPTYEWVKSWADDAKVVQVLGGISADRGEDPGAKDATVHGVKTKVGPLSTEDGMYTIVDWSEANSCGTHEYAVATKGLSNEETVQIADTLKEPAASNY